MLTRARLALVIALGLIGSPGGALAQGAPPRQPAGQANQNVAVDCDQFADGVHDGPIVVVTSPTPGATLFPDNITIQGFAADCHVDIGAGINRVSVFLGGRDAGGIYLGDAALRGPSPIPVVPADQYQASSGWVLKVQAPLKPGELNDLFVYARSELTNIETSVKLPIMAAPECDVPSPRGPPPPVILEPDPAPINPEEVGPD
jgi:hypothetical protein